MEKKHLDFESDFDIDKVSFRNVSSEFEKKFRNRYQNSLKTMSNSRDKFINLSGANTLGILEKMAQHMDEYNKDSNFEESYNKLLHEYERFTET